MDVVNFDGLKAQDKIIDPADVDPNEDYFLIGKYTNHYRTNSMKATNYPIYAIKAGDVMGGGLGVQSVTGLNTDNTDPQNPVVQISVDGVTITGDGTPGSPLVASIPKITPTLQEVLDNNHDLLFGNNFQGTNAGVGNTGVTVIAIGNAAAFQNTGVSVNAIGNSAALQNTGNALNAIGNEAARDNTGDQVNSIGSQSAKSNTGDYVNALGLNAASSNTGNYINAVGLNAADLNTGDNVIALGTNAGIANPLSGMFIISNSELPSYADHAAAVAAISPTGIPNNTYIYHNQATMSIGAVRL